MKITSFKRYLEEEDSKAIVHTGINSKGIDNSITKDIINSRLAMATNNQFLTPYIALGSIARVLAYANIIVPQYTFLERDEGEVVFDATQFGQIAGVNLDGSPARSDADHFIYFSYSMNDDGYYDCFAALVDSDELERILDMGGDDDVDHVHVDQKVNEETDYFAGVRPSLDVFKHTDEKGTKHFLAFHKNGDITYHNKTSDGTVGNSHPEMKPLYAKSSKDHMQNALYDFARHVAKEKADEGFDKWRNKLKKRNWLRKSGYEKASVDPTSPSNTAAMAVRAGRDKLKKEETQQVDEAMRWDETSSSSLPAMDQDTIKGHEQASTWHAKMLRQVRMYHDKNPNAETRKNVKFHSDRMAHHNGSAHDMRMQGMKEELKGDQHKLDVAEPKGKLTSADFNKLRGEEVDERNTHQQTKKK